MVLSPVGLYHSQSNLSFHQSILHLLGYSACVSTCDSLDYAKIFEVVYLL